MGDTSTKKTSEWPAPNPPLREGQGEELRAVAGPEDDVVFEANVDEPASGGAKKRTRRAPPNDDARTPDDDAQHSRTER